MSVGPATVRGGVRVTALGRGSPGTQFRERAGVGSAGSSEWIRSAADDVVNIALRDLARGRLVSVPDWKYTAAAICNGYTPHDLLVPMGRPARARLRPDGV